MFLTNKKVYGLMDKLHLGMKKGRLEIKIGIPLDFSNTVVTKYVISFYLSLMKKKSTIFIFISCEEI